MAQKEKDCVLLDSNRYNPDTKLWGIPILKLKGVKATELHIGEVEVHQAKYRVEGHHIRLLEEETFSKSKKGYLVISFNPKSLLLKFWLPIILAVLATIGALAQPILYNMKLLYQPPLDITLHRWEYDEISHKFFARLILDNLQSSDQEEWEIHLFVRKATDMVDSWMDSYVYVAGPFRLSEIMEVAIITDEKFTKSVKQDNGYVQGCMFKAKKDLKIEKGFSPAKAPKGDIVKIGCPRVGPFNENL